MNVVEPVPLSCPYCGETIELLIDCSVEQQQYVEDCEVCCQPIAVSVAVDEEGLPQVDLRAEND